MDILDRGVFREMGSCVADPSNSSGDDMMIPESLKVCKERNMKERQEKGERENKAVIIFDLVVEMGESCH